MPGMYSLVALFAAALVIGNFWLWRQLRLEYELPQIFTVGFGLSVAAFFGWWSPLVAVLAATLVLVVCTTRLKIDFWQWWDMVIPLGLLIFAPLAPGRVAISMVVGWAFLILVSKFYRRFSWYKSGRMGLVGSLAVAIWSVIQIEVAKFNLVWVYLAVLIGVSAAITIYIRSGRQLWPIKRNRPNQ